MKTNHACAGCFPAPAHVASTLRLLSALRSACSLAAVGLILSTSSPLMAQGTWTTKAPMPTPRLGLAAAAIDGIIYAVGGDNYSCGTYSTVEAYDTATNTWTTQAPMPTPRHTLALVQVGGILYA